MKSAFYAFRLGRKQSVIVYPEAKKKWTVGKHFSLQNNLPSLRSLILSSTAVAIPVEAGFYTDYVTDCWSNLVKRTESGSEETWNSAGTPVCECNFSCFRSA
ncbi:hypothetical protein TNCT_671321 [Trichonephila clavata]|uniref:Uncharacterized protein n=1 Tax=Trichonephila clavata TaxID=2740835 RepID=A0A8X6KFA5_TRICU|nr:hypothetical protein TNCT_671321 [Trichonephila clavata]